MRSEGVASSLASVFEPSVATLEINEDAILAAAANRKGLKYGWIVIQNLNPE